MSSLPKNASLSILILNNILPNDQRKFYVTADEIRERLVHCGVGKKLTQEHVLHAKTYSDRDGIFLRRRKDRKISYFRSPQFEDKCPDEQRWRDSGLPDRTVIAKAITPPKLHNYFNQHKAAHHNLSILNEALDKIKSTPTKNNNKQQQKKKKKRGGSNNTPTPGNALASGNRTTDDMSVDTEQPLVNTNDDSTTAGVKRHGEPLEKSDCENELPPDGQLWSQRKNPSYYYQSPWVPPPPMMQLA